MAVRRMTTERLWWTKAPDSFNFNRTHLRRRYRFQKSQYS